MLPYKGMGQLEQLQSPNIWGVKSEDQKCYRPMIIKMASHTKKKISSLL